MPAWQEIPVAPTLTWGKTVQSVPQVPQFLGSLCSATQLVPQVSGVVPLQFAVHLGEPDVEEQTGIGVAHAVAQEPHVFESLRLASHPSLGVIEQWANPEAHAVWGTLQTPAPQVIPVAPIFTFAKVVQSWPQVPQFLESVLRSTQLLPHMSGERAPQLAPQDAVVPDGTHRGVAPPHLVPHVAQFSESRKLASHPSSGRDEQCPYPVTQAAGGTVQIPARHSTPVAP